MTKSKKSTTKARKNHTRITSSSPTKRGRLLAKQSKDNPFMTILNSRVFNDYQHQNSTCEQSTPLLCQLSGAVILPRRSFPGGLSSRAATSTSLRRAHRFWQQFSTQEFYRSYWAFERWWHGFFAVPKAASLKIDLTEYLCKWSA